MNFIFFEDLKYEPKCKMRVSPNSAPVKSILVLRSDFAVYHTGKYFYGI